MIRSSNPALKPFEQPQRWDDLQAAPGGKAKAEPGVMTLGGTIQASAIQMGCALGGAFVTWIGMNQGWIPLQIGSAGIVLGLFAVLFIGGMIMARSPQISIVVGPILSALYGGFAGMASFFVAWSLGAQLEANAGLIGATEPLTRDQAIARGAGVVLNAILLTFGVVLSLLALFTFGKFRLSGTAMKIISTLIMAVMFTYVAGLVMRMLGFGGMPLIHEAGPVGIAFSGFVVVLASFNVLMSFQTIEMGVQNRFPKHFEWYAGYALVTAVIWLYIEILYLLYKLYLMFGRE
ncbi:MAG: Bax inhibitor-1/YccA family protein [Phycisphaerales bacterium]|nr:MAG: Bax inhibitor-1/YccA family protein [Phycisphaerales bacterium]